MFLVIQFMYLAVTQTTNLLQFYVKLTVFKCAIGKYSYTDNDRVVKL
jgi:hypothetical protein